MEKEKDLITWIKSQDLSKAEIKKVLKKYREETPEDIQEKF